MMALYKRGIKGKEYYYLKYSQRKQGKVITKEKYIGKELPWNFSKEMIEMKKELQQSKKKELYLKLEAIKKNLQNEWKKTPNAEKEKELREIAIAFTYNTNAIEGSTITLEETRNITQDQISPNKSLRDVKETEKHYFVFLEMLKKKEEITNNTILEWHKRLFEETKQEMAGQYREYGVRVGMYIAPDWQDVKKLMNECINFMNKNKEMNAVERAARGHYQFEKVHPFGDGNGRVGRLLMNHILWHEGYPMLIIEYKKRNAYYKALQGGEEKFTQYFLRRYLAAHKKKN